MHELTMANNASGTSDVQPKEDRDKRRRVVMGERDTRKPSGKRRSAAGGPPPAGRTRQSRRAEQGGKQDPARPCAPQSAQPDQPPAERSVNKSLQGEATGEVPIGSHHGMGRVGQPVSNPKPAAPETLSQKGALKLAKRLERYWHGLGFPAARFWAEPIGERFEKVGSYELYRVASNLVDGLPPRYLDHAETALSPVRKKSGA
jgi:hypothetical protein